MVSTGLNVDFGIEVLVFKSLTPGFYGFNYVF